MTLNDFFQCIDKENGGNYSRLLVIYNNSSIINFSGVLQALLAWRKKTMLEWPEWNEIDPSLTDSKILLLM